jgi:hypothetical protein
LLAATPTLLSGGFELAAGLSVKFDPSACEQIVRRHIADGAMQPDPRNSTRFCFSSTWRWGAPETEKRGSVLSNNSFLPAVEHRWAQAQFFTQLQNWHIVNRFRLKMTAFSSGVKCFRSSLYTFPLLS